LVRHRLHRRERHGCARCPPRVRTARPHRPLPAHEPAPGRRGRRHERSAASHPLAIQGHVRLTRRARAPAARCSFARGGFGGRRDRPERGGPDGCGACAWRAGSGCRRGHREKEEEEDGLGVHHQSIGFCVSARPQLLTWPIAARHDPYSPAFRFDSPLHHPSSFPLTRPPNPYTRVQLPRLERQLGVYRVLGWRVSKGGYVTPLHLSARSAGTCARAVNIRALGDWLPIWESVALRLARKIRR